MLMSYAMFQCYSACYANELCYVSVIFGMYADESFTSIQRDDMDRKIVATEEQVPAALAELFSQVTSLHSSLDVLNEMSTYSRI